MFDSLLHSHSQSEEDLSSFIQIFKRSITNAELLSFIIERGGSLTSALKTAWEISEQLIHLSNRHILRRCPQIDALQHLDYKRTFNRFLYRLIEIIANCKIKYQYTTSNSHDALLERLLKQIQAVVRSGKQSEASNSFVSIINLTKLAMLKYCSRIIAMFDEGDGDRKEARDSIGEMKDKIKEQFNRIKQAQKVTSSRVFFLIANLDPAQAIQNIHHEQKESLKFPSNQTFSEIRKKFDSYVGMDLDFTFFRASYFQAKSHYDSFYKDYVSRNSICFSSLQSYSEQFQGYEKRKDMRILRINKDKIKQQRRSVDQSQEDIRTPEDNLETSTPRNKQINKIGSHSLMKMKIQQPKSCSTRKERDLKDSLESDRFTKKALESTHKYLTSGFTHKILVGNDQENLNHEPQKSLLRLRTQTDKFRPKQEGIKKEECLNSNGNKREIMKGFITSNAKVTLKTKYFEMKCLPEVLKESSMRNRMIFNHKFCIKQSSRNKSKNWLEKKLGR